MTYLSIRRLSRFQLFDPSAPMKNLLRSIKEQTYQLPNTLNVNVRSKSRLDKFHAKDLNNTHEIGKTRQVILLQLEEYLQKVLDVQANPLAPSVFSSSYLHNAARP
jgi:hypothetical protein